MISLTSQLVYQYRQIKKTQFYSWSTRRSLNSAFALALQSQWSRQKSIKMEIGMNHECVHTYEKYTEWRNISPLLLTHNNATFNYRLYVEMGDCGKHLLCKGYNARKTGNIFLFFQGEKHCSFIYEVGKGTNLRPSLWFRGALWSTLSANVMDRFKNEP